MTAGRLKQLGLGLAAMALPLLAFALLDSALVGAALRWSWRLGERDEVIAIGPKVVEVWRSARAGVVFHAHPGWVRLQVDGDGERITLASSGHRCEVGAFLGPGERRQLARRLRELLVAQGPPADAANR